MYALGFEPSAEEVKRVIEIADQELNGYIDFPEFLDIMAQKM